MKPKLKKRMKNRFLSAIFIFIGMFFIVGCSTPQITIAKDYSYMDIGQILSWVVGAVGLLGFYFAGKRVWWSWYINIFCQGLWISYALATGQPAFLVTAAVYSGIFGVNAYKWTKEHLNVKRILRTMDENESGTILHNGVEITYNQIKSEEPYCEEHASRCKVINEESQRDDMPDIELAARTCHEANRILQAANDEETSLPWHLAPKWQTDSAIEGVLKALDGETAEELHASWCRSKFADGWVFGEFKDADIKTHPCLVPYFELQEAQRIKDHMFRAIVKSFKTHQQHAHVPQS